MRKRKVTDGRDRLLHQTTSLSVTTTITKASETRPSLASSRSRFLIVLPSRLSTSPPTPRLLRSFSLPYPCLTPTRRPASAFFVVTSAPEISRLLLYVTYSSSSSRHSFRRPLATIDTPPRSPHLDRSRLSTGTRRSVTP